ncbi:mobile mystery protein A [Mucilaginibacter sp. OK283]|jgi:predicted DNA-binding mobile mystery protein A|uniref:mobile mystery protein A n=1 Tax=Mucilaginibacter sp. OK283 TaxID=1881049 RepID=UPI0008C18512|nr:mobile mystery protein A [Mucilaginibacter sp. OK283]SEP18140.1 mobile mystery protein A [Mucilaginibacter sp. OK283]
MKNRKQQLIIEQMDKKLTVFKSVENVIIPSKGWLNAVRVSLKMTLQQLGNRLNITAQSANDLEMREALGTISLNRLQEAANALDMKFVYGIIPKDGSIELMIEKRAKELAQKIVLRTSNSMKLEDQENSGERIEKAINEKAEEIKAELPKYLWE